MADRLKIDYKNMGFYFGANKETMHKRAKDLHQTVLFTDKAEYHFYHNITNDVLVLFIELIDENKKPIYNKFEKICMDNAPFYIAAVSDNEYLGNLNKWELYDMVLIVVTNWLLEEYLKINKQDRKEIRKKNKKKKKEKE